jgi:cyclase
VAIGGAVTTIDDINSLLKIGADKVIIKTAALTNPQFIKEAADFFGAQCITIAVDAYKENNIYKIFNHLGVHKTAIDFVKEMQDYGAGEIILNSVDHDGLMNGFNHELINLIAKETQLPIINVGGGGKTTHYSDMFKSCQAEAVGSASIFHFTQYTPLDIKNELHAIGKPVRL